MTTAAVTMRSLPYNVFELTLMVTGECNLRCSYCYMGGRRPTVMEAALARRGIDRALASLQPQGRLELGFFGGEPLLQAEMIEGLIEYARSAAAPRGQGVSVSITTNGTVTTPAAWRVMSSGIHLAVSCDGAQAVHDRHRPLASGLGSWRIVCDTLRRLVELNRDPVISLVVRPDTLGELNEGLAAMRDLGVRFVSPSLDLWTTWREEDIAALGSAISRAASLWRPGDGGFGIGWFDDMASRLAGLKSTPCARCLFGAGQIAVSPAGNLYPCERLIGLDAEDNPARLRGTAMLGEDFLDYRPTARPAEPACADCTIRHACSTFCRCSNLVRTGDPARPDRLLCELNKMVFAAVSEVLGLDGDEED